MSRSAQPAALVRRTDPRPPSTARSSCSRDFRKLRYVPLPSRIFGATGIIMNVVWDVRYFSILASTTTLPSSPGDKLTPTSGDTDDNEATRPGRMLTVTFAGVTAAD